MQPEKETTVTFAERLRRLMAEHGLQNPTQLARATGLSHVAVGNYLNKGRIPETDALRKLCDYFKVTMDDLIPSVYPHISVHTAAALVDEFLTDNPEKKSAFERYVESLLRPGRRASTADAKLAKIRNLLVQIIGVIDETSEEQPNFLPSEVASNQKRKKQSAKAKRAHLRDIDTVSIPLFGNIPAGWPQATDGVQAPDRTVRVHRRRFLEGVFGLVVRGDSMNAAKGKFGPILAGETVILLPPDVRDPRHGDIVAALCDGQTTLKRLDCRLGPKCVLRAESDDPAWSSGITPIHDLTIQGVVVGKL